MDSSGTRLNKFLAMHLAIGRREADNLIIKGKVFINGKVSDLGARVRPGDKVQADGRLLHADETLKHLYIMLNKPVGYVCSRRQQGDNKTIYDILPPEYRQLKTVGRLDKDSSGLILLTNDGDFSHRLTHPSFNKVKKYEVVLDRPLAPLHHQMINDHGVNLTDGNSKLTLERLKEGDAAQWIVIMHEGRNRQIRRTFAALGYDVDKLHRTDFGDFSLQNLASGKTAEIQP